MFADSPAKRLLMIMELMRGEKAEANILRGWQAGLRCGNSQEEVAAGYTQVLRLVSDTAELVRVDSPAVEAVATEWQTKLLLTLMKFTPYHNPSNLLMAGFIAETNSSMVFLTMADSLIGKSIGKANVDESALEALLDNLMQLFEEVSTSTELTPLVRSYFMYSLNQIILALNNYKITGQAEVLRTTQELAGRIILDPHVYSAVKETSVGNKIRAAVTDIAACVGVLHITQEFILRAPDTVKLLSSLGS
ncbi:hypothetical protein [Thalassolituus pacificus]|uniref:Uncharacterized protein n=1 Tax=Thalassolituus pacificus TaxID=2975440 RepID=A0A9X3AI89_9GAMM|nr:hypothetical protein [Thalassolituus pacificus]MCT7360197.1 hypothetical protein [Thalassolituus pacificus]